MLPSIRSLLLPFFFLCRLLLVQQQQQCSVAAFSSTARTAGVSSGDVNLDLEDDPFYRGTWLFRHQYPIAYERIGPVSSQRPVLLLNGFGMGSFHQHRLMKALVAHHGEKDRAIYGIDYLGQGDSWPIECDDGNSQAEQGLQYSADTWVEQIVDFIDHEFSNNGIHLVGNSVGGLLAVAVAARRPERIASLVLINATPIWGLNLPGWSGHLPAPPLAKAMGRYLFDVMRRPATIHQFLDSTYANPSAFHDTAFVQAIRSATETTGGHAAFSSILWSPPLSGPSVYETLSQPLSIQCPVALVFGREDPWCTPAIAQRMLRALQDSSSPQQHRYFELEKVGHCPNHEAPQATAMILSAWMKNIEQQKDPITKPKAPFWSTPKRVDEAWGSTVVEEFLTADDITSVSWWEQWTTQLL